MRALFHSIITTQAAAASASMTQATRARGAVTVAKTRLHSKSRILTSATANFTGTIDEEHLLLLSCPINPNFNLLGFHCNANAYAFGLT